MRSPTSPHRSARRSSQRSRSRPPRDATTTTARSKERRSGTAAAAGRARHRHPRRRCRQRRVFVGPGSVHQTGVVYTPWTPPCRSGPCRAGSPRCCAAQPPEPRGPRPCKHVQRTARPGPRRARGDPRLRPEHPAVLVGVPCRRVGLGRAGRRGDRHERARRRCYAYRVARGRGPPHRRLWLRAAALKGVLLADQDEPETKAAQERRDTAGGDRQRDYTSAGRRSHGTIGDTCPGPRIRGTQGDPGRACLRTSAKHRGDVRGAAWPRPVSHRPG